MKSPTALLGFTVLTAALALTGCGKPAETPVTEPVPAEQPTKPDVEVSAVVAEQGGAKATVVVAKSTEDAEQAFIATTKVETLTAKVAALNIETRKVTLVGEKGAELNFIASEETKNLAQVSVGDTVNIKHVKRVTIQLVEEQGLKPSEATMNVEAQAKEGEMPARAEIETTIDIYTVEAINIEENTFVLKNVQGQVQTFTAKDPKNLARASLGDAVVVTTTEALAVEVVKATAE
jgi:hypothetical protein